jgi:Mrp family chromosome partitioning ATPase
MPDNSANDPVNKAETSKPKCNISSVLAVMSGKGGVGKSSVAGLLASSFRRRGLQVGVLDADITGPSIPKMFGVTHLPEVGPYGVLPVDSITGIKIMSINLLLQDKDQPVVWRGPLIGRAIQQYWNDIDWGDLDFLIIDLPPGTADAALTVMQSLPLDGVLLVTSPQDLAGMVVRKAANMAKHLDISIIGLVENMSYLVCPECNTKIKLFGASQAQANALQIGIPMLGDIQLDTKFSLLCDVGMIEDFRSDDFERIVDEVLESDSMKKQYYFKSTAVS